MTQINKAREEQIRKTVEGATLLQLAQYLGEEYITETVFHHILNQDNPIEAFSELNSVEAETETHKGAIMTQTKPNFDKAGEKIYLWRIVFETEDGRQYSEDELGIELMDSTCAEIDEALKNAGITVEGKEEGNIIRTIEQLKAFASDNGGFDCYILLNGGLKSSKHISYAADEKLFYIDNYIDGSEQVLTEAEIVDPKRTNIGEAMAKGALIAD